MTQTRTHLGGYACGAEEARVLVHVERDAAHVVGLEHARAEVMDEAQRRDDERRGPGELLSAIGRGVVSAFQCGEKGDENRVSEMGSRGEEGHMSEKERALTQGRRTGSARARPGPSARGTTRTCVRRARRMSDSRSGGTNRRLNEIDAPELFNVANPRRRARSTGS